MKPRPKEQVHDEAAQKILRERRQLLAIMRRKTTLPDEEIIALLSPFSDAVFDAGRQIGRNEAEWSTYAVNRAYRIALLITIAIAIAAMAWFATR